MTLLTPAQRWGYSACKLSKTTKTAEMSPRQSAAFLTSIDLLNGREWANKIPGRGICPHVCLHVFDSCPPLPKTGIQSRKEEQIMTSTALSIGEFPVRQIDGLYSLNDLHRASGNELRHRPVEFLRIEQTQELVQEIQKGGADHHFIKTTKGRNGGTFACRELVIAYASWISPAFHLKVIRVFLDTIKPHNPAVDYDRISPEQRNVIQELVSKITDAGIQKYGETWRRFHNKFKVNSYLELPAAKFDEAVKYLTDKLDQKELPPQPSLMDRRFIVSLHGGKEHIQPLDLDDAVFKFKELPRLIKSPDGTIDAQIVSEVAKACIERLSVPRKNFADRGTA